MNRWIVLGALFLLPVMILLPHLDQFAFQPVSQYSDMLVSHYPNALFLQQAVLQWKTFPLWSPAILSGYPFVANPLSGLAYLPGWLALLMPLPLGLNLVMIFHLIWGGVGMFLFLRSEHLKEGAALLGALLFESMPKLYSHLGAGHVTLIYAAAWTPWLLYTQNKTAPAGRLRWLLPGVVLGILALADVRWAAYAGLLWMAYSLRNFLAGTQQKQLAAWLGMCLTNIMMAGLVAAPLLLPLAEYTRLSTRIQLTAQESFILSLPPGQLLGLIFPNPGGSAEWVLYPGAVTFALALYGLSVPAVRKHARFWLGMTVLALLFAMGSYIPFLELAARLPGMDLLRVPARVLFLSGFGFAAAASYSLQSLLWASQDRDHPGSYQEGRNTGSRDRANLVLFGVTAFAVMLTVAVWRMVEQDLTRLQFVWGTAFLLIGSLLVVLARGKRLATGSLTVLLFGACLIDIIGVNGLSLSFQTVEQAMGKDRFAAELLNSRESAGSFRVYSPSYSISQQVAARYGLELADGVDPLQLAGYASFMETATGVPSNGYSVTLPPFANAEPASDNQSFLPDVDLLGLLNVKYIVAEFPLADDRLQQVAQFDSTRIYLNPLARPRAWVQQADDPVGINITPALIISARPNTVKVIANGPGLLVLSDLVYPGWQVLVDGKHSRMETAGGLLRGVQLPEGEHEVEFIFRPVPFYLGLGLAGLGWVIVLAAVLRRSSYRG